MTSGTAGDRVVIAMSTMLKMPKSVSVNPMQFYYLHQNGTLINNASFAMSATPYAWGLPTNHLRILHRLTAATSHTGTSGQPANEIAACAPPQCHTYMNATELWASIPSNSLPAGFSSYSTTDNHTWFRFTGAAGTALPTQVTNPDQLGFGQARVPPDAASINYLQTANSTICFDQDGSGCMWNTSILVTNCGTFNVYQIRPVASPRCMDRSGSGVNGPFRGPNGACWYLGSTNGGHHSSCTSTCTRVGSSCSEQGFLVMDSWSKLANIAQGIGQRCTSNQGTTSNNWAPYRWSSYGYCSRPADGSTRRRNVPTCAAHANSGYQRFCPCY